jgi:hypothetical protein
MNEQFGQILILNGVKYPLLHAYSEKIRPTRVPQVQTGGPVRWDEFMGCYRKKITDFSGPLGQQTIDMENDRQGHLLLTLYPSMDGSLGHLTGPPKATTVISPSPAIPTTKVVPTTTIGCASLICDRYGQPRAYVGVGNEVWRSCEGAPDFQLSGSANAAVTCTPTTLVDTRQNGLWTANQWVGFTVTCGGQTLVVTANGVSPFTLTGTGKWSGTSSGTSTAIGSGTPGTLTDATKSWTVNQWVGKRVMANGKTLTVASNTATVLTGTAAWSPSAPTSPVAYTVGYPNDGQAWEMHDSLGALANATQITSIISFVEPGAAIQGWVIYYLVATGAAQSADVKAAVSSSGTAWDSVSDQATIEQVTEAQAQSFGYLGGSPHLLLSCTRYGDLRFGVISTEYGDPTHAGKISAYLWGLLPGRTHYLGPFFPDTNDEGVWMIAGGRLYCYCYESLRFGPQVGHFRSTPAVPPLVDGCMWQRRPTVTDGCNIWTIQGDRAVWIGLPPQMWHLGLGTGCRFWIESLNAAGHLLIASVKASNGTSWWGMVLAYDEQSGQWRNLWALEPGSTEPSILGTALVGMEQPTNPSKKYLLVSYARDGNSYVVALHLPRGFVGVPTADDEFGGQTGVWPAAVWVMPTFTGGDPAADGVLLRLDIEVEIFENAQLNFVAVHGRADNDTMTMWIRAGGQETAPYDGIGRYTKTYEPPGGLGFKTLDVFLSSCMATDTMHPYIHSIEYWWRKRGDATREYVFDIDADTWLAQGKTYADLWSSAIAAYETRGLVTMSIVSEGGATILAERYVSVSAVEALPDDPRQPKSFRITCEELV